MIDETSQPLVSCIMPTFNRREFVPLAIRYFLRQDYENKELIIIDDGTDVISDLVPKDERIRYFRLNERRSVGAKRNLACENAKGTIVAHWDDDDWYASNRLSIQIDFLSNSNFEICGINKLLYYDLRSKSAYEYNWRAKNYLWLSLLCYRRQLWMKNPFPDIRVASDTQFLWQIDQRKMAAIDRPGLNVCLIHETNLSPKRLSNPLWRHVSEDEVRKVMGEDWSFYDMFPENQCTDESNLLSSFNCNWTVIIPTYERPELLQDLLSDLEREAQSGIHLDVRVYNDASDKDYSGVKEILERNGWLMHLAAYNHAKAEHWRWIDRAFRDLEAKPPHKRILFVHDDYRLCYRFFSRVIDVWNSIKDPQKLALTVAVDERRLHKRCWTGVEPVRVGEIWKTQWVDSAFICEQRFFEALSYRVPPVKAARWKENPNLSSGVGRNISVHLVGAGFNLYRVSKSLARHVEGPSMLHPNLKSDSSAKTVAFIDNEVHDNTSEVSFCQQDCSRKWVVVVMSYERPVQLLGLLHDLAAEKYRGVDIEVRIYDDASRADYSAPKSIIERNGWRYFRSEQNHGKQGFWRWVSRAYKDLRSVRSETLIAFLQDDIRLCHRFFERAELEWNAITDPKKVSLTVLVDALRENRPCWTGVRPKKKGKHWMTQWVDQIFVANRGFLEAIDFQVPPISSERWRWRSDSSSGVGQAISQKLHQNGWHMYRVHESLVVHLEGSSVMNSDVRSREIMTTVRFVDGLEVLKKLSHPYRVSASLATVPDREDALSRTVNSLLPQVDCLRVYLNGFKHIPAFLEAPQIEIARNSHHGDLGDSGKFFWCDDNDNSYLLTCDDDIIYPPDYVAKLIGAIERYKIGVIVGFHGIILKPPVRSYYRDRKVFHCSSHLDEDQYVHMVGTGCAAWHSSTLEMSLKDFKIPNMADIWLGRLCQKQEVPVLTVARNAGWIQIQDVSNTIFERCKNNDPVQTRIVNEVGMWRTFTAPIE